MEIALESGMCLRVEGTVQSGKEVCLGAEGRRNIY